MEKYGRVAMCVGMCVCVWACTDDFDDVREWLSFTDLTATLYDAAAAHVSLSAMRGLRCFHLICDITADNIGYFQG
jgi:hypothetical protein